MATQHGVLWRKANHTRCEPVAKEGRATDQDDPETPEVAGLSVASSSLEREHLWGSIAQRVARRGEGVGVREDTRKAKVNDFESCIFCSAGEEEILEREGV